MKMTTRLARLQKALAPPPCYGPPIDFVEIYEGEQPPDSPPCPCGSKHLDRVHQIVVVRHREDGATTEIDGQENSTGTGRSEPCA